NDVPEIAAGSVTFHVFGDDVELYASEVVRRGNPPLPIEVSLAGVRRLRLVVADGGDGAAGDYADWADAAIARDPAGAGAVRLGDAIAAARAARQRSVEGEEERLRELAVAELLAADHLLNALGPGEAPAAAGAGPSAELSG